MIRLASVPAENFFVNHIRPLHDGPAGPPVEDVEPVRGGRSRERLDPGWLRAHAREIDLMHVHYGFESLEPEQLRETTATVAELGIPLVLTVHHLQNVDEADDAHYLQQLGVLIEAAREIVTLTPGAGAEIERRWGRPCSVIAHPHVVPFDQMPLEPPIGDRLGLRLGDLRARIAITNIADDLRSVAARWPLTVDVETHAWEAAAATRELVGSLGAEEIAVRERLPDGALFEAVRRTRAQLLPYRWGTHSSWLEMCLDLGVAVAAPSVGYLREQHPGHELVAVYDAEQPGSLQTTTAHLLDVRPVVVDWAAFRRAQRDQIAAAYAEVYGRALEA